MIADTLRFLWKRSSMNAACAIIGLAQYMTPGMMRQIAEYLNGLADDRESK